MPQLMSTDDPEALSDTESSSGTDGSKRKAIDREEQSEEEVAWGTTERHWMKGRQKQSRKLREGERMPENQCLRLEWWPLTAFPRYCCALLVRRLPWR